MPIKFRFRWIPLLATVAVVTLGIILGQWQMRRAAEKQAIGLKLAARAALPPLLLGVTGLAVAEEVEYRRVRIKGEYVRNWAVYLDNRPYRGVPGVYVLMPLKIAGSANYALVARGWAPRDAGERTRVPQFSTPDGEVEVEGMAIRRPGRLLQLGQAAPLQPNAMVQNVEVNEFAQASKFTMLPFLIEQQGDLHDGLVRDWPQASLGIEKHWGYAFQWYALAVMAAIYFLVTGFRRGTK